LQLYAEKDRNGVPVIKKEQERRSGAFRLETNPGHNAAVITSLAWDDNNAMFW